MSPIFKKGSKKIAENYRPVSFTSTHKTLARGDTVDTLYLDFSKTFDTVPHRRLIVTLEAYGINGSLLGWIFSLVIVRTQKVFVNGSLSFSKPVLSGIPRGSVLFTLLFVIYINHLPDKLCSSNIMFSDDINNSVGSKIKKANKMLELIIRFFSFLNADILLPLYMVFVHHLVEYGAPVWSGHTSG